MLRILITNIFFLNLLSSLNRGVPDPNIKVEVVTSFSSKSH